MGASTSTHGQFRTYLGHPRYRPARSPSFAAERAITTINSTLSCPNRRKRCFFAAYYGQAFNNKTKMIKRQMYGRAGFDLLRHRILLG